MRFWRGDTDGEAAPCWRSAAGLGHLVGQLEDSFHTTAVDVNRHALREARGVAPHTHLEAASAERLPFARGSFDVVIIKHIIEHLPRPELAIAELGRVLRPGGCCSFRLPTWDRCCGR
jgi:ubiquinone/menaquinone biosynthesis C-methylase UbiE